MMRIRIVGLSAGIASLCIALAGCAGGPGSSATAEEQFNYADSIVAKVTAVPHFTSEQQDEAEAKAYPYYRASAERGYAPAETKIAANLKYKGHPDSALIWYHKAAAQGNVMAIFNEGEIMAGDEKFGSLTDAVGLMKAAIDSGYLKISYSPDYDKEQYQLARGKLDMQLGSSEIPEVQLQLGNDYLLGRNGKPIDSAAGLMWTRRAAAQGEHSALFIIGLWFREGVLVPRNGDSCLAYFHHAAVGVEPVIENTIGDLYRNGGLIPVNLDSATYWYNLAVTHGSEEARHNLVTMAPGYKEPVWVPSTPSSKDDVPANYRPEKPAERPQVKQRSAWCAHNYTSQACKDE